MFNMCFSSGSCTHLLRDPVVHICFVISPCTCTFHPQSLLCHQHNTTCKICLVCMDTRAGAAAGAVHICRPHTQSLQEPSVSVDTILLEVSLTGKHGWMVKTVIPDMLAP